jgi:hypothetical protein
MYRDKFLEVCNMLASDFLTVKQAISLAGDKISYGIFRRLIREEPEFEKIYISSKKEMTEVVDDVMTEIINDAREGKINAKDAMHICRIMQWKMEKLNPRRFGDRGAILVEETCEKLQAFIDSETNGKS